MKGVKIILGFLTLIALSYIGMVFIRLNDAPVSLSFGIFSTEEMPLGFVALSCTFTGMVFVGLLSVYEMVGLYIRNRSLWKRIAELEHKAHETPHAEVWQETPTEEIPAQETVLPEHPKTEEVHVEHVETTQAESSSTEDTEPEKKPEKENH